MPPSEPKWSARARSGVPAPVLPFDPESVGLALGLRRLIKRETRDDAELAAVWLASEGLRVRVQGHVVFAAHDEHELNRAVEAERAGDRDPSAVRHLGEALGYPSCCVAAYLARPIRNDAALFEALLGTEPAPPETLWLIGPLGLISHAPCSLQCAASRELGARLLAGLDARYPGFAGRWLELARRVHVLTRDGRALALELAGGRIRDARAVVPPDARVEAVPELSGRELASLDPWFVADHRGSQR